MSFHNRKNKYVIIYIFFLLLFFSFPDRQVGHLFLISRSRNGARVGYSISVGFEGRSHVQPFAEASPQGTGGDEVRLL